MRQQPRGEGFFHLARVPAALGWAMRRDLMSQKASLQGYIHCEWLRPNSFSRSTPDEPHTPPTLHGFGRNATAADSHLDLRNLHFKCINFLALPDVHVPQSFHPLHRHHQSLNGCSRMTAVFFTNQVVFCLQSHALPL